MARLLNTYQQWIKNGILESKIKSIRRWASQNATQKKIAQNLGISEKTFIELKKKYPEINKAIIEGEEQLKQDILDALYKRAVGYNTEDEVQNLEVMPDGRRKQKITKTKRHYPPDVDAAKYLLFTKFGREFHPKKEELEIMEKKLVGEEWEATSLNTEGDK